jgi:hypothetical protein
MLSGSVNKSQLMRGMSRLMSLASLVKSGERINTAKKDIAISNTAYSTILNDRR